MSDAISIPLWLFLPLLLLAMAGLWLIVIVPLASGYFYRRRQRAFRKLDERLEFGLSEYALARRSDWLDRLLNDEQVAGEIASLAEETGTPIEDVRSRARKDAEEIVPLFKLQLYFRFGYWLAKWLLHLMYQISKRFQDRALLDEIPRDSCVVVVSNHRSNVDPFLLIYLGSKRSAISYSAGEWARGWPIRYILHAIGFYIIRRDGGGDRLYNTLVQRYVYLAASHCIPQGLFLEGALSRDGTMQERKLGLLSYLLKARGANQCRDMVFVPVGLNYDRTPEDRSLVAHSESGFGDKSRWYPIISLLRFLVLIMPRTIGLSRHYGSAVVNYGAPLHLSQWLEENQRSLDPDDANGRRETINQLGEDLSQAIDGLIPVMPVSLLAHVLLEQASGISEWQLKSAAIALGERIGAAGFCVAIEDNDEDRAFTLGIYRLTKRRLVEVDASGSLRVNSNAKAVLEYYANSLPKTDAA